MRGKTHLAAGMLTATAVIAAIEDPTSAIQLFSAAVLGAWCGLLPDIDHPNSKISHKLKTSHKIISLLCSHRGLFHSPTLYILIWAILMATPFGYMHSAYICACGLAIFSHLILDGMNPAGVSYFFPFSKKRFHFASFVTGGKMDCCMETLFWIGTFCLFISRVF